MPRVQRNLPDHQAKLANPLLRPRPPIAGDGNRRLWWAVIHRAALDLGGPEPEAADALEFFKASGIWLCVEMFGLDETEVQRWVLGLVLEN